MRQSYTPASSATDYVIHDQQGTPLGYLQSGTAYAFGTDNLGSVTNVVASNGTTVGTYAYTPYGHINSVTGTSAGQNLLRYTGALYDTTSNYWHLGNRWNNAYTNNFTTQDTSSYLSSPQDGNRYAYASDNPANYTDPTGNDVCTFRPTLCGLSASVGIEGGRAGEACAVALEASVLFGLPVIVGSDGVALPAAASLLEVGTASAVGSSVVGVATYLWGCI